MLILPFKRGVVSKLAREFESLRREAGLSLDDLLAGVREVRAARHARACSEPTPKKSQIDRGESPPSRDLQGPMH